jgi:hypothetical protein
MLRLEGCLAIHGACRQPIEDEHGRHHRLAPKIAEKGLCLHHAPHHTDDALVTPLNHFVLLQGVRSGELMLDAAISTVPNKFDKGKLPPNGPFTMSSTFSRSPP